MNTKQPTEYINEQKSISTQERMGHVIVNWGGYQPMDHWTKHVDSHTPPLLLYSNSTKCPQFHDLFLHPHSYKKHTKRQHLLRYISMAFADITS